jgi:hypothetical protein
MYIVLALVVILIILLAWMYYYNPPYYAKAHAYLPYITPAAPAAPAAPASTSAERFNPKYDRTFHQSTYDTLLDKTKDSKGLTVDDYALADLLTAQHAVAK